MYEAKIRGNPVLVILHEASKCIRELASRGGVAKNIKTKIRIISRKDPTQLKKARKGKLGKERENTRTADTGGVGQKKALGT